MDPSEYTALPDECNEHGSGNQPREGNGQLKKAGEWNGPSASDSSLECEGTQIGGPAKISERKQENQLAAELQEDERHRAEPRKLDALEQARADGKGERAADGVRKRARQTLQEQAKPYRGVDCSGAVQGNQPAEQVQAGDRRDAERQVARIARRLAFRREELSGSLSHQVGKAQSATGERHGGDPCKNRHRVLECVTLDA